MLEDALTHLQGNCLLHSSCLAASPPGQVVPEDAAGPQGYADGPPVVMQQPGGPVYEHPLSCLPNMMLAGMDLSNKQHRLVKQWQGMDCQTVAEHGLVG